MSRRSAAALAVLAASILTAAHLAGCDGEEVRYQVLESYVPLEGLLRIGPEPHRAIPLGERGHTLVLPELAEGERPAGLLLFPGGPRATVGGLLETEGTLHREAVKHGVAILHLTLGNPIDFYFGEEPLAEIARELVRLRSEHGLDEAPLFLAGMSLEGTRALRVAIHLARNPETYGVSPAAVAVVDAPIDMVRFWESETRVKREAFHPAAADEGEWVTYLLEKNLGGTPADTLESYVGYSPYTHVAPDGGNAVWLKDVAVRAYHEPDVNWWIENRRKSYHDMNSIDLAGLVNRLRLLGNQRAELVTTHQRRDGFEEGVTPHTWTIVDDPELLRWFLGTPRFRDETGDPGSAPTR